MDKQYIIRITLFVSILIFNPAVAETLRRDSNIGILHNPTIEESIASQLHNQGLEEGIAQQRAADLVKGNERLFAAMLDNLIMGCGDISKEEMLTYLSSAALHRRNIELSDYDQLIGIYSKLKRTVPDKEARKKLRVVAKKNSSIVT